MSEREYYSMDEPAYWETPERWRSIVDRPDRRMTYFAIGEGDEAPAAGVLEMPPGYVVTRHAHDCERFEVIIKGSLDVGERTLYPGDVMVAHPGQLYGPHVAGPDGCTSVEFFSRQAAAGGAIVELEDGTKVSFDATIGDKMPGNVAGMEGVEERVAAALGRA